MQKRQIGQYTISFPIKKGVYAETFRVHGETGKNYFLKLINMAKLSDQQLQEPSNSITEIEIVATLNHPNLLHMIDHEEIILEGQRYAYYVCDYIAGETVLDKMRREKHCTVYDIKRIISGVLNGLKFLHRGEEPIIHNEISPKNIMLDMSTNACLPVIIDFGHAQKLTADNTKLYIEDLNPFFMAPEMFHGIYSTRTDLYSVGTMMYYLLFGIYPWFVDLDKVDEENRIQAILNERKNPLRIPNVKIFELDESLLNIIAKATDPDVDKRFQSPNEFLLALSGEISASGASFQLVDIARPKPASTGDCKQEIKKGNGFADIAGLSELKQRLQDEVIDLFRHPDKYAKLRVKVPNGILLYGPPGCGKTFLGEKFAEEIGCNYMYVRCSDVASPYIHGGQEKIAAIFEKAKKNAPTVLFLDELDAMIADRSRQTNVSEYGEVNEFLTHLNNCADNKIIVVGATNNPKGIDPAALRSGRLDIKVYVPAPDEPSRVSLLELYLKDISTDDIDYVLIAKKTDGYVSKDICFLINKAALLSVKAEKEKIDMQTMLAALNVCKSDLPSVSSSLLAQFDNIRAEFEGKKKRNLIGFK
ncbi:MAG: AAA family ATPase [Prevotellaceae bacterium]|nr:AAA family ATPase [Prevotellaceae bacterium]